MIVDGVDTFVIQRDGGPPCVVGLLRRARHQVALDLRPERQLSDLVREIAPLVVSINGTMVMGPWAEQAVAQLHAQTIGALVRLIAWPDTFASTSAEVSEGLQEAR